jgi:hypothetical protein
MNPIFSFMPNNIVETNDSLSAEIKQDGLFNNAPSLKQEGFFFDEDFFCDELAADSFDAKKIFKVALTETVGACTFFDGSNRTPRNPVSYFQSYGMGKNIYFLFS